MSKNTNLSFLTDYITADITNGRIGINNASPSYAFDVNGTMRTSGATYLATASGNVGIGTTGADQKLVINQGATSTGQGIPATTGTTQNGILRLRPAVGVYGETLDFGMNVSSTYGWIQATNSGNLATNYALALNPNGGNVGIGTTTPDVTGFGWTTLTIKGGTTSGSAGVLELQTPTTNTNGQNIGVIAFLDGSNRNAQISVQRDTSTSTGNMMFYTNAGAGIVERMRISSAGITTIKGDAGSLIQQAITAGSELYFQLWNSAGSRRGYIGYGSNNTAILDFWNAENGDIKFGTNNSERMRITSGGNVLIGTSTDYGYKISLANSTASDTGGQILMVNSGAVGTHYFFNAANTTMNTQDASLWMRRNGTTSRSINASGTINASGADYAEYMVKETTDDIAKGDIVGVNSNGKLTNIFADSVSFVIKSTDPSYVGGDTWFNIEPPLEKDFKSKNEFEIAYEEFKVKREEARNKVDRIAFSGQIPCNVLGANVGDYIIPINNNGKIKGQAISNPTFEQYQNSIAKVWKIMEDGRAWVAVKIG